MAGAQPAWDIPDSWQPALEAARRGGLLVLIGGADSGKSTLAAVLASAACDAGHTAAVVDADMGQSSIGPPTCVSLGFATQPIRALTELHAEAMDFIGVPAPVGHLLSAVAGVGRLAEAARQRGAETLVVDTTGLISGSVARALKSAKVHLLQPDWVVALQREDEAEHLLQAYRRRKQPEVLRLRVSRLAKERSREQRGARRQRMLAQYFRESQTRDFAWEQLPMENTAWTTGRELPGHLRLHAEELLGCEVLYAEREAGVFIIVEGRPGAHGVRELRDVYGAGTRVVEASALHGLLVGLQGESGDTRALGILEGVDFRARRLRIFTPLAEPEKARALRLGSIQVDRSGAQLGWLEPGELG